MFQLKRDFNAEFCAARNAVFSKELNPEITVISYLNNLQQGTAESRPRILFYPEVEFHEIGMLKIRKSKLIKPLDFVYRKVFIFLHSKFLNDMSGSSGL